MMRQVLTGLAFVTTVALAVSPAFASWYSKIDIAPDMKSVTIENDTADNTSARKFLVEDVPEQKIPELTRLFKRAAADNNVGGEIDTCDSFIDIPGSANHAYGAFCFLEQGGHQNKIALCDAERTNSFTNQPTGSTAWTKADLIKFVVDNCVGG